VRADVPPALDSVCRKAMSPQQVHRYPTPQALAKDIEHWLADESVSAWAEPIAVRARRWMRRHWTLTTAAAAVLVRLGGLGIAHRRESGLNARLRTANSTLDRKNDELLASNRQVTRANADLQQANLALGVAHERTKKSEAEANRQLDQTLAAVEDYYTGVGAEVLLGQKEFQALRARLLERPRQFYEQMARELEQAPARDERAQYLLAKGRVGLGRIAYQLGRHDEARRQDEANV